MAKNITVSLVDSIENLVAEVNSQLEETRRLLYFGDACIDVLKADDEDNKMLHIHFYERPQSNCYKAEIFASTDYEVSDNATEMYSNGMGEEYIRELIEGASKVDLMAVQM
jgi:hypothetical protein